MNVVKKIAYNTIIQVIGRVIGLFIMLVTVNFVSNYLFVDGSTVTGYGQYHIIFTYVSIIGVAADLGLFTLLTRELAGKTKKEISDLIGNALGFRFVLFIATLALFTIFVRYLPYPSAVKIGILIGVVCAFTNLFSQILAGLFQAKMVTDRIVIAETIGRIVIATLTIIALKHGMGLIWVVVSNLLGNLVIFALSLFFANRFCEVCFLFNFPLWKKTGRELSTIAIITLLSLIHFKIDSLIMSFYRTAAEVGLYGLAYKILEIIAIIPSIYASNVMPHLAQLEQSGERERMARFTKKSVTIMTATAIPIAILVYLLAPWFIVFISSKEFIQAANPLRILIFAIAFAFIAEVVTGAVTAARCQKKMIWAYSLAVILNIILNIIFIPKYSYIGAASTTVTTEFILMICVLFIAKRNIGKNIDWLSLFKLMFCGIITLLAYYEFQNNFTLSLDVFNNAGKLIQALNIFLSVLVMGIIYGLSLILAFGKQIKQNNIFVIK